MNKLGSGKPSRPTDEILAVDPKGTHASSFITWTIFNVWVQHLTKTAFSFVNAEPPVIILDAKLLAGLTAKAGTKIDLPADVTGKPEPKVKWTKADLVLKADDRVTIDTKPGHSVVSIAKTKREDTATYIIEAVNSSGRATETVDVNILGLRLFEFYTQ